jgi:hypothetical protein
VKSEYGNRKEKIMTRKIGFSVGVLTILVALHAAPAFAQSDAAQANNPLANFTAFNVQNYYVPQLSELDDQNANTFWLRYAKPLGRVLFRGSLRASRVPTGEGTTTSGLGDLNAFFAYLVTTGPRSFGIGPSFTFPTASKDETGTGKYQAGFAAVYFDSTSPAFQWGGLLTWETDFAGDEDRADVSAGALQPFYFFQLGKGVYIRGAPIWVYNFETDNYHVPVGLGIGKVFVAGKTVFNFFIEPQYTILDKGPGQPEFQIYTAINMQFK